MNATDRALVQSFREISSMADRINLPGNIVDKAKANFKGFAEINEHFMALLVQYSCIKKRDELMISCWCNRIIYSFLSIRFLSVTKDRHKSGKRVPPTKKIFKIVLNYLRTSFH